MHDPCIVSCTAACWMCRGVECPTVDKLPDRGNPVFAMLVLTRPENPLASLLPNSLSCLDCFESSAPDLPSKFAPTFFTAELGRLLATSGPTYELSRKLMDAAAALTLEEPLLRENCCPTCMSRWMGLCARLAIDLFVVLSRLPSRGTPDSVRNAVSNCALPMSFF
jgi:hypothetical protein